MVQYSTFILVVCSLVISIIGFEKYFNKKPPMYGVWRMILNCIIAEAIAVVIIRFIPQAYMLLICGSIVMGVYVSVYYRHKPKLRGEY